MITSANIFAASILIVDDLEANVLLLEQTLRGAGYECIATTRNPESVCDLHRKNRYDLILLDLEMPGLNGFQVMENLKEIETGGYLPVLVLTAKPEHKLRALKAGAKDFLSKPFDLSEVLLRVYNMVEIRLLHLELTIHNFARLENAQRIAGLGDWEYDLSTHNLVWSDGIYRILGIARKDLSPNTDAFDRLVYPPDLEFMRRERLAAAQGLRPLGFEHRLTRPDGVRRYFHQVIETTVDAQGRPVRESGTIQDVTERKLMERDLRLSEERYRLVFERSPSPSWVFDHATFAFLAVNDAAVALYGYSRKEFLAMTVLEIRLVDTVPESLERLAVDPEQARIAGQTRHRKKNGQIFPLDILTQEIHFDGQPARLVLIADRTAPSPSAF